MHARLNIRRLIARYHAQKLCVNDILSIRQKNHTVATTFKIAIVSKNVEDHFAKLIHIHLPFVALENPGFNSMTSESVLSTKR